jgi:ribosomal protein S18 acetylase RimI-like enzyme
MNSPLDNPVWHALSGPHARFAIGRGLARQYPREIAPFAAIAEPTPPAYADLAADLPAGVEARLFRPANEPPPPGWQTVSARPILQMVGSADQDLAEDAGEVVDLGAIDIADMLALADAAKPGPFDRRTVEMGRYAGVRREGRLVAMAGERLRLPGFVEISAIATDPEARGQGHASRLARHLMKRIFAAGDVPFLHVYPDNPALGLYEKLGFKTRATLWVLWRKPI